MMIFGSLLFFVTVLLVSATAYTTQFVRFFGAPIGSSDANGVKILSSGDVVAVGSSDQSIAGEPNLANGESL